MTTDRVASEARGRGAETACAWLLRANGYRLLARRWRGPVGEIDLIARRRRTIVFVEVKARPTLSAALEAVTQRQRLRIEQAAEVFLSQHPKWRNLEVRFDVVAVMPGRLPRHIRDAWRPGLP